MARRLLIVLAATMAVAAGCGGGSGSGNGEEDKSAGRILTDARSAATGAGSVHVTGTILDSGTRLKLDLRAGDRTGSGTITFRGSPVRVIRIGKTPTSRRRRASTRQRARTARPRRSSPGSGSRPPQPS